MSEYEQGLLAAVAAEPKSLTPRLVLADYYHDVDRPDLEAAWRRLPHHHSAFESLIGRTVTGIRFDGEYALVLETDAGPLTYTAEGDCCSVTWFYRLRGIQNLIGHKVVAVHEGDDSDVDPADGLCRQDVDGVYAEAVITPAGVFDVVYRCSSNGYYGGWLHVSQAEGPEAAERLEADWQAAPAAVAA